MATRVRFVNYYNLPRYMEVSINAWFIMEYPTKYGLIWYSTSTLGSWNSHWYCDVDCFGDVSRSWWFQFVCHVMVIYLWYIIGDSTWFEMYVCDTMAINCEYSLRIWISQKNNNEWFFDKWFACSSSLSTSMTSLMFRIDACQNCWSKNI